MKDIIEAIQKNLEDKNYYSALFLAVMLPSICGALESENGEDSRGKYIAWYDKNIKGLFLKGNDCYQLRCSLLHQAKTTSKKSSFSRVIFTFPVPSGNTFHNNVLNDVLNLDIPIFCRTLVNSVNEWLKTNTYNKNCINNMKNTIKVYPKGLPPYIVGHPIIS